MIPWEHLGDTQIPHGGDTLSLYRRGDEYSLRIGIMELMNSRRHGSEEELATLAAARLGSLENASALIGGLGLGYTLRATLDALPASASVTVAELVPQVVTWNVEVMGHLAGNPLDDPRTRVFAGDVADVLHEATPRFDLVLLDVDNGPETLTHENNGRLYTPDGLARTRASLKPGGVLAIWSTYRSAPFVRQLTRAGFVVDEVMSRARHKRDARHTIWLAQK